MQETWVQSLGWEDSLEKGYPLQYFSLENSMELCIVHRVTELDTTERLSLSLPLAPPGKLLLDLLLGHQGPITTILLSMTTLDTRYKWNHAGLVLAQTVKNLPGSGRSPGEWYDNSLQYSCLENSMDTGTWWATVPGVAKSQTRLSLLSYLAYYP